MDNAKELIENLLIEARKKKRKAKTKMVRLSKKSQLNRAGGRSSINIAKKRNDPMYKRYVYFRKKYLDLKTKLMKKYGRRGMRAAKKSLM